MKDMGFNLNFYFQKSFVSVCCACLLLAGTTSCVNEIASPEVEEGEIPITFELKIKKAATKVAGDAFETGDRIGLFATITGESLKESRYIDNLMLKCGTANKLQPERVVFYPEGDAALDFVAYYPYAEAGLAPNGSLMPVAIQTDQNNAASYSASDFMTASKTKVKGSEEAVVLTFNHQLTKLKIVLVPGEGLDIEELKEAPPRLVATGFYTQAQYDLAEHTFSDFASVADVLPAGEWQVKDKKLEGCEFILLPQAIDGTQAFQMDWNGRVYTYVISDREELEGNTQYQLEINLSEMENPMLDGMFASIEEWPDAVRVESVENMDENAALHVSVLSFETSHVYRVYQGNRAVAEICKEYLLSDALASAAITAYPVDKSGEADLTKGVVLQLLGVDEDRHGGTLCWDEAENTFVYQSGERAPVQVLYFDETGKICPDKPAQPVPVHVVAHTLREFWGDLREYPIVKVGTQYWMRENLKTTYYRNGTAIPQQSQLDGTAGYFRSKGTYPLYFYNGEALMTGEISPEGWRIPSLGDWERLEDYVCGDASLLKGGPWEALQNYPAGNPSDDVQPVTNETMLDIRASGIWLTGGYKNAKQMVGFWSWDAEEHRIPDQTVFFVAQENKMVREQTLSSEISGKDGDAKDFYKSLSIRCIKE